MKKPLGVALTLTLIACGGTESGELDVDTSANALACNPSWTLASAGSDVCLLDSDGSFPIYRIEHYTADRYRDTTGCMADAYRLRETLEKTCYFEPWFDCVDASLVPLDINNDTCAGPRIDDLNGSVTASPGIVQIPAGSSTGTTQICWNAPGGKVTVSVNGGSASLFASGNSGCQNAPWIQLGKSYDFTVHAYNLGYPVDHVIVLGVEDPGGCPPGQSPRCGYACWPDGTPCP